MELCEFCKHGEDAHDYDIHNENGTGPFSPATFPFELICYDCMGEFSQSPPLGTETYDHFARKQHEQEAHVCLLAPLPRWMPHVSRQNSWIMSYGDKWFWLSSEVTTSSTNNVTTITVTL